MRRAALALLLVTTTAAAPSIDSRPPSAVASFALPDVPFLPGSVIPLELNGVSTPFDVEVLGPGRVNDDTYAVPDDATGAATLFASGRSGVAMRTVAFAKPPDPAQSFIAVASYEDGVVVHDAAAPFARRSVLAIGGAPSDVAIDADGKIGASATNGTSGVLATLDPWHVTTFTNVPFADEAAFDPVSHALFVTNRDRQGSGAVTRIGPDGSIRTRILGLTAEGIAIDGARRRAYVANVNDGTISIVDLDSLVELRRFAAVPRVFSVALDTSGTRLYAVSNQSYTSPFGAAGSVIAVDVGAATPRIIARSKPLAFPIGVAVGSGRVFVTDERDDDVYVLDPRNLRPVHEPLSTCRTPWKPAIDGDRLFLPCARANQIDAYDSRTLKRLEGAPFATGDYPLAVAVWHPASHVKR